jgi:hypothetical protein
MKDENDAWTRNRGFSLCVCVGGGGGGWERVDKDGFTEISTVICSYHKCFYVINQAFKCEFLAERLLLQSSSECRKCLNLCGDPQLHMDFQVWNTIDIRSKGYCNSRWCVSESANIGGCVQIFAGFLVPYHDVWNRDDYIRHNHMVLVSSLFLCLC